MLALLQLKPETTQKDLTFLLGMSRQATAELLSKLEKQGLIEREPSADDKRVVVVRLTEAGKATEQATERPPHGTPELLDVLDDDEVAQLSGYLARILERAETEWAGEFGERREAFEEFWRSRGGFDPRMRGFGRGGFPGGPGGFPGGPGGFPVDPVGSRGPVVPVGSRAVLAGSRRTRRSPRPARPARPTRSAGRPGRGVTAGVPNLSRVRRSQRWARLLAYRHTVAAVARLSDSALPRIGTRTTASASARSASGRPHASLPNTQAVGPARSGAAPDPAASSRSSRSSGPGPVSREDVAPGGAQLR